MKKSTRKAKELKSKLTQMVLEEIKKADLSEVEIIDVLGSSESVFRRTKEEYIITRDLDGIIEGVNQVVKIALNEELLDLISL